MAKSKHRSQNRSFSQCTSKNRRGWVKLVEAFLSILLITGVMIIIINQQKTLTSDTRSAISDYEVYMLRSIELNEALRGEILGISESSLPVNQDSEDFPEDIEEEVEDLTPGAFSCEAKICSLSDVCSLEAKKGADVYAQKIFITSTHQIYSQRQLKLFCWAK
jgi:hypothetical protein